MKTLKKLVGKTALGATAAGMLMTTVLLAESSDTSGTVKCPSGTTPCVNGTAWTCCAADRVCQIKNIEISGPYGAKLVDKSVNCCKPSFWNLGCLI